MKLLLGFILLLALVVYGADRSTIGRNDDLTIPTELAQAVTDITDGTEVYSSLLFTNGWSIVCSPSGLEFVAP